MLKASAISLLAFALALVMPSAEAQEACRRAVVIALPGVTWEHLDRWSPPAIMEAARAGAVGSISVRTIRARTSYAAGFATMGAGTRVDAGAGTLGRPAPDPPGLWQSAVPVAGMSEMRELAEGEGYGASPGALGDALGDVAGIAIGNSDVGLPPPAPAGFGRWALLTLANREGSVDRAAVGPEVLVEDADAPFGVRTDLDALTGAVDESLEARCDMALVIDPGDLARADRLARILMHPEGDPAADQRRLALAAADRIVGHVMEGLDTARDLLLIATPSSPLWDRDTHLGVAIAVGDGFEPGATLESATTRRRGIVTLPDVAPTVLAHLDLDRPSAMNGRRWRAVGAPPSLRRDRRADRSINLVEAAVELDREAVFVDGIKTRVWVGYVLFQLAIYPSAIALLARRRKGGRTASEGDPVVRVLEAALLLVVAFPLATYLAGTIDTHPLGPAGFLAWLVTITALLVAGTYAGARRRLDRLFLLMAVTSLVLAVDLVTGSRLQLNTVFGYSPIIAGRFSGAGNTTFSFLAAAALLVGTIAVHRLGRTRNVLVAVAALFAVATIVDGAPQFGSDFGGVLSMIPGLGLAWVLLSGRRPNRKIVALSLAGTVAGVALYVAVDVAQHPGGQTHVARLVENVADRGPEALRGMLGRKIRANVHVFRTTIFTVLVPPALFAMGWLLLRPSGRWRHLAGRYPTLRAGLIGGLLLGVLGFLVNDSGIVIPALMFAYFVPLALAVHASMETGTPP